MVSRLSRQKVIRYLLMEINYSNRVHDVDLGHLDLLQEELDTLGQSLAHSTDIMGIDQLRLLNDDLWLLINEVC